MGGEEWGGGHRKPDCLGSQSQQRNHLDLTFYLPHESKPTSEGLELPSLGLMGEIAESANELISLSVCNTAGNNKNQGQGHHGSAFPHWLTATLTFARYCP